jgi:hypothetical protein
MATKSKRQSAEEGNEKEALIRKKRHPQASADLQGNAPLSKRRSASLRAGNPSSVAEHSNGQGKN